jgi:F-type H+-transporting ATPase subunit delta
MPTFAGSDFRGGSADAVAALTDQLGGLARAATTGLAGVADDLFAVARTLRAEGSLRRFATDNSVAAEARSGLVGELFAGKVSQPVLDLLGSAVSRRWTRTRDLADAMEHLGVVAAVRSAGDDADRLVDEIFTLRSVVGDNADLRNALSDPARSQADKAALLDDLLAGRAHPATLTLARQALSGSYRTVSVALEEYEKVAADVHGERVATVRVARPLADADAERLTTALSGQYGRQVHLNVVVDPSVVGGIRVEIGDDVIDGTVSSRLADARRLLAG